MLLQQATTPALFDNMKREIKARQEGGWKSVRWSIVKPPKLRQMNLVHGRIMAQNPKVIICFLKPGSMFSSIRPPAFVDTKTSGVGVG